MKNALGYCRVSGRSQKDGTSLDEQEEQIDVWAHANGYTIIATGDSTTITRP